MSTMGESLLNPTKSLEDCEDLDQISQLPDELLVKVLLFLPTKVAVKTLSLRRVPRTACLPSLKTLSLRRVTFSHENSLHELVSICPVLENLFLERRDLGPYLRTYRVICPSLLRLTLKIQRDSCFKELMIDTPSLKYFKVTDYKFEYILDGDDDSYSFEFKDMPNLEEAYIDSTYPDIDKFVRSITSVKRLSLCIRVDAEEALYREGIVFNQLKHLKLCPCDTNWSKLLVRLLKDSPNLQELEVYMNDDHKESNLDPVLCWDNELNCVPECLLSSLETFKWTGIQGSPKVIDLAKYILRTARCLKAATILFRSALETENEREMVIQELLLSFRGSTTHTTLMFSFI